MAVRRFQRNLGYTPQPTQTGAADVAADLAGRLQRFAGIAADVADQRAQARGLREGALAGGVAAPEQRSESTVAGRAFNAAAQKAHAAAVDTEVRLRLTEFAEAHPSDPDAFDARVAGFQKGLLDGADPVLRPAIEQELALQTQRLRAGIAERRRALFAEQTLADTNAGVDGAISGALGAARSGDLALAEHERGKAVDLLTSQVRTPENPFGLYTAEQVREKLAALDADLDTETVLGAFQKALGERPTPETIAAAAARLDAFRAADAASLGIAPERKDDITQKLEAALVDGQQAYQRRTDLEVGENAAVRGRAFGDLYRKVQAGDARVLEVEDAYSTGLINAQTRGMWLAELDRHAAARREKANGIGKVAAALEGRAWLDPKDNGDKASVDAYYANMVEGQDPLSPEMLTRTVELAVQTGIVPETVRSFTRSFQRSPDPNRVVAAAEVIGRLEERAGAAIADIPEQDRAFASMVNSYMAAGTDAARAVELARETVYKTDPDVRKKWDKDFNTPKRLKALESNLADRVDSEFGGWFTVNPSVEDEMVAEYSRLARGYYTLTRDDDIAEKHAFNDLKRTWAVTSIGGPKRMMKYAPEAIYGGGDWLEKQFAADVSALGLDPKRTIISVDERTAREQAPSYALITIDEDGLPQPVLGKRWRPAPSDEIRAEQAARKAEGLAEAKAILDARAEAERKFELLQVK